MKGLTFFGIFIFFITWVAWSQDVKIQGVILQPTVSHQRVPLMSVDLSPSARNLYLQRIQQVHANQNFSNGAMSSIQLGMENVPVLNQGIHGSCVIFAAAAAVDAILKKGDYVSPLCSLQLGRYLQTFGYLQSGWDGALAHSVLSQLEAFGFLSKEYQNQQGCGGLYEYPLLDRQLGTAMSLTVFHPESESLLEHRIGWSSILDVYQSSHESVDMQGLLTHVKAVLSKGDRVIIGVLLAEPEMGLAGAVGTYRALNDTWLLTPEIQQDMQQNPQYAGHALLVTGYDDNAYAKDDFGRIHRGLITLRNSWGDKIGDHGNFYMSYDYFKSMVMEIQRIRHLNNEQ